VGRKKGKGIRIEGKDNYKFLILNSRRGVKFLTIVRNLTH